MRIYFKFIIYLVVFIWFSLSHAGSYDDFFTAIKRDDAATVTGLLNRGFDPNTLDPGGHFGLMLALKEPSLKVVDVLVAHPATKAEVRNASDESPLMLAAIKGLFDVCKRLIALDADVNKPGWTPLHYAATAGQTMVMALLLDHHAYIDAASPNGSTPLMMASMYGTTAAVKLLLEAGADPNLKNSLGLTAIDFARRSNQTDSIEVIAAFVRARKPAGTW
jgi:ankyrin repeat protein